MAVFLGEVVFFEGATKGQPNRVARGVLFARGHHSSKPARVFVGSPSHLFFWRGRGGGGGGGGGGDARKALPKTKAMLARFGHGISFRGAEDELSQPLSQVRKSHPGPSHEGPRLGGLADFLIGLQTCPGR